jgi:hypothetical protein
LLDYCLVHEAEVGLVVAEEGAQHQQDGSGESVEVS